VTESASTIAATGATSDHPLEPIFHPRSVAIIGVPSGKSGMASSFLGALLELKFQENHALYPVNPKMDEIEGLRCYPSLLDIEGEVDHVISVVPARVVPMLVEQCIEKGIRSIHFFTAGFSETGDAELAQTERTFIARLNAAGIRAFGPNCMGLYVPDERLGFMSGFPGDSGEVFLLSQSGANAGDMIHGLAKRGVRFSKAVSFGNGADVKAHHLLDYAASDPQTRVVAGYMEGVQEGRKFFEALKRCAAVKPTIILKGGIHAAGARAANSHTGSLAGSIRIFEAACRQAGALRAETMDDLQDMVVTLTTEARRVDGTGVVLVSGGGGYAVLSSDAVANAGLDVPRMPQETIDQLREFIPVAGTSVSNPIDANVSGVELQRKTLQIVARAAPTDVVFTNAGSTSPDASESDPDDDSPPADQIAHARASAEESATTLAEIQRSTDTPFVAIERGHSYSVTAGARVDAFAHAAHKQGVAVYPSVPRAACALGLLLEWRKRREGLQQLF
jgi:acyl-CoA synthetase (NDP forming)